MVGAASADLIYNPGEGGGATELDGLSDVADLSGAASGEVLEYNGTKWTNATASAGGGFDTNTYCRAWSSTNAIVYTAGGNRTVQMDTVRYDGGGNYNGATYTYTTPSAGFYQVSAIFRDTSVRTRDRVIFGISGGYGPPVYDSSIQDNASSMYATYTVSYAIWFDASEAVTVYINPSTVDCIGANNARCSFTIYKLN
jgi:hypothetical protein